MLISLVAFLTKFFILTVFPNFWQHTNCDYAAAARLTPIGPNVVTGKPDVSDIKALADSLTYSADGETQLSGHVRIEQAGRLLEADSGQITRNREYGRFDGNIRLAEPGLLLTGDQIVVNLETSAGQLSSSEFVASQMNAHGRADRIRRYSDGVTILDHGIFTTCAPGKRAWSFEARDITLDPNTGVGKIYNAKLRVADVPVIYLPYFRFPIDDRRQSGILVPRFGNTNDGGFDFSLPVYLNLAPQLDATLTPRLLTSRGAMLESEFRYLSRNFGEGTLNAAILPDDRQAGRDRKSASLNQRADWGNGWSARTSLNYVSDNAYFTDLGTDLTQANKTHQERVGEVFYDTDFWHFTGRVQGFQTIDPGLSDADHPYSRLPQLLLTMVVPQCKRGRAGRGLLDRARSALGCVHATPICNRIDRQECVCHNAIMVPVPLREARCRPMSFSAMPKKIAHALARSRTRSKPWAGACGGIARSPPAAPGARRSNARSKGRGAWSCCGRKARSRAAGCTRRRRKAWRVRAWCRC